MSKTRKTFLLIFIVCLLSLTMIIAAGCNKNTDNNSQEQPQEEELSGTCVVSFYFLPTDSTPTFTRKVDKGTKIGATKIPNPTRDGYEFGGWYKDKNLQNAFNTSSVISQDMSLYASWIAPYKIQFYLDIYTDEPEHEHTIKIYSNQTLQASQIYTPTKDKYDFDGWYTDKEYQTKYVFSSTVTSSLNLYAKWISQYTILSFETFSGKLSDAIASRQVRIGEATTLPTPTRGGCEFNGWYLDINFTQEVTGSTITLTEETTLYAKWTINHTHSFGSEATTIKYPSCTEDGKSAHICSVCGEIDESTITTISALGHNWDEDHYVDGGSYHYIACTRCSAQKDIHSHEWNEGTVVTAPTCTEEGVRRHTCTLCSATKTSVIEATGHSYNESSFVADENYHWIECTVCHEEMPNTKEAHHKIRDTSRDQVSTSCDKENIEGYYCDICDHDCSKHTPAKAHTPSDQMTYDEHGHWRICTTCGAILDYHEHNLQKDESQHVDSTCIDHGKDVYVCSCGYQHEVELELSGHQFKAANGGWVLASEVNAADSTYTEAQKALLVDYDFKVCQVCHKECEITPHELRAVQKNTWVTATCTTEGYQKYVCNRCGSTHEDHIPMTDHTHPTDETQITILQAATCTEDGTQSYTCTKCHQLVQETIPAGHKWEIIDEALATCTINGYIRRECSECHAYEEVILHASHTFNDSYSYDDEKHWYTCAVCGERTGEHEHDLKYVVYGTYSCEGTVTAMYYCEVCGYKSSLTQITGPGHQWDEGVITKNPSCSERGEITYTCSVCHETRIEYIPMVDHTYDPGSQTKAPTCTVDGVWTYVCTVCGHEKTERIPALGHDWDSGTITVEQGCETTGTKVHHCTRCTATYDETLPALGHDYVDTVTPPTCTTQGYTKHHCNRCDHEETDTYVAVLGHNYVVTKVVHPTCKMQGYTTYTCTRCGDHYDTDYTPTTSHHYAGFACIYCGNALINEHIDEFANHGNSNSDTITINNEEELILFLDYVCINYISTAKYIVFNPSYIATANVTTKYLTNNLWPTIKPKMITLDRNFTTSCTNNIVSIQCDFTANTYHSNYANNLTNYDTDYEIDSVIQDYFFAASSTRANDWDAFAYKAYEGTFSCSTSDQLVYALTNCIKPEVVSGSKAAVLLPKAKEVLRQICDDSMTDAEKVTAIYKWIVANVYEDGSDEISITDTTYASNFAESVFGLKYKLKSGAYQGTMYDDCMFATSLGISKAFVLLTGLEGIRGIVVSGTKADAPYYWNKVLVDTNDDGLKEWYAIDLISALRTYSTSYKIMSTEQLMVSDSFIGLTSTNYADCVASSMYNYYANGEETNLFITTQAQMDTLSAYITAHNSKTTTYKSITIFVTDTAFVSGYTTISSKEATINNTYGYIVTIAI